MNLGSVVSLNAGLIPSRKRYREEHRVGGYKSHRYSILNLQAIDDFGNIDHDELEEFVSYEALDDQYLTKEGMILVRVNYPYTCAYIDQHNEGLVIPSYFIILDEVKNSYDAIFLSWFLNSRKVKHEFTKMQSGTLVPNINQKILSDIELPNYSLKEQKELTKLYKLMMQERKLYERLIKEKEKYYQAIESKIFEEEN